MDSGRHTSTNYLKDEKTHKAINGNLLQETESSELYIVWILKGETDVEHKKPINFGLFCFSVC